MNNEKLIDKLIVKIEQVKSDYSSDVDRCYWQTCGIQDAIEIIRNHSPWININDEMPPIGEVVICMRESIIPDSFIPEAGAYGFFKAGIWGNVQSDDWSVIAWTPIPEFKQK